MIEAPPVLWRISNYADLTGVGGERTDGRWHTAERGKRIVYLSENAATALLEVLANLKGDPGLFPDHYQLLTIQVARKIQAETISDTEIEAGWKEFHTFSRRLGDEWLARKTTALLRVPSVPAPESWNYLLNPLHPDAMHVQVALARAVRYDKRLFHLPPI